jgi:hypothetical protein
MDYLRRIIGVAPTSGGGGGAQADADNSRRQQAILERHTAPDQQQQQPRLIKLRRAQEMQLDQLHEERADIESELSDAVSAGNRKIAAVKLNKRRELDVEIRQLQGKLNNTQAQLSAIQTSHANVEQVLLIKEGAAELQAATQVIEQLDVRGAMDSMQDSMAILEEQSRLLTEPIGMGGKSTVAADYEAELELNALMATGVPTVAVSPINKIPDVPAAATTTTALAPTEN